MMRFEGPLTRGTRGIAIQIQSHSFWQHWAMTFALDLKPPHSGHFRNTMTFMHAFDHYVTLQTRFIRSDSSHEAAPISVSND
jgi:hypothetical protein